MRLGPGGGLCGGQSTHFLLPEMTAFQADVELGSCGVGAQQVRHGIRIAHSCDGVTAQQSSQGAQRRGLCGGR